MKGMVLTGFGLPEDVLKIMEVEKPVPKDTQVLIRVKASSINVTESFAVPLSNVTDPSMQIFTLPLHPCECILNTISDPI